ncbi:MAG: VacJ family lipoprotein [Rhodospirillales bacterium]|nr:VacJ family lipoprotein [Rhodospirillales bacterium]
MGRFGVMPVVFLTAMLVSGLVSGGAWAQSAPAKSPTDQPAATAEEDKDPLESLNRFTFQLNTVLRKMVIDPVVDVYQAVTPDPLEKAISNITANLTEPVTAASSLLQGDTENAGIATKRFLINTTAGLGGTNDVAADEMGLERRKEDLGQAAGAGGMSPGPYLVLPILGPSSTRDALGDVAVSIAVPPAGLANTADNATAYSDNQDDLNAMTRGALDPYIVEREAYLQRRQTQVSNDAQTPLEEIPEFEETK